jgi:hypothetical protein
VKPDDDLLGLVAALRAELERRALGLTGAAARPFHIS